MLKIHDFYYHLLCKEVKRIVRMTHDNLDGTKADLTRAGPK